MKRVLVLAFTLSALAVAQRGQAVRAGGGPKVQPTPKVAAAKGAPATAPRHDVTTHLTLHPQLVTRLQPLLPAGVAADAAAAGFKNTGQFIAALHVSKNLGIPFDELKAQMTGPEAKSLGRAIQTLKPDLPKEETKRVSDEAQRQARADEKAVREKEKPRTSGLSQ